MPYNTSYKTYALGTEAKASVTGNVLTLEGAGTFASDYGLILIEAIAPGRRPLWTGFLARVQGATTVRSSGQGGIPDTESGHDVALMDNQVPYEGAFQDDLLRIGSRASFSDNRVAAGKTAPSVAAIDGDDGPVAIVFSGDGAFRSSLLPEGAELVEDDNGWGRISGEAVYARRALTSDDTLFDVDVLRRPEQLTYSAPTYWKSHWFDEEDYPGDAELVGGKVVYRNALESPTASPTPPSVTDVDAESYEEGIHVFWGLEGPNGLFDHPTEIRAVRSGDVIATATGTGEATLELTPGPVELEILGHVFQTTMPAPLPEVTVTGQVAGDATYIYRYDLSEEVEWTDPFGDTHTDESVELERPELIHRHIIQIHTDDGTRSQEANTSWDAPHDVVFTRSIKVGYVLLPAESAPEAHATRYRGVREETLSYDVLQAGTYHVEPVGYLPPQAEGDLESYVEAGFLGPAGQHVGSSIQLDRPTEVAITMKVSATENGHTPIVFGARTVRD